MLMQVAGALLGRQLVVRASLPDKLGMDFCHPHPQGYTFPSHHTAFWFQLLQQPGNGRNLVGSIILGLLQDPVVELCLGTGMM